MNSNAGEFRAQTPGDERRSSITRRVMITRLQRDFIARWTHPRPTHFPGTPARAASSATVRTTCSNVCATLRGCRGQWGRSNCHCPPRNQRGQSPDHNSTIAHTINATAACTHTLPHSTPARTTAWRAHTLPGRSRTRARTHTRTPPAAIMNTCWVYSNNLPLNPAPPTPVFTRELLRSTPRRHPPWPP